MPFGIIPDLAFGFAGIPSQLSTRSRNVCDRFCEQLALLLEF
jgi:hypothetical protein